MSVLSEEIQHHVKEEEMPRDGMFAQAKKSDIDLDEIGAQLAARKAELLALAKTGNLPRPELATTLA